MATTQGRWHALGAVVSRAIAVTVLHGHATATEQKTTNFTLTGVQMAGGAGERARASMSSGGMGGVPASALSTSATRPRAPIREDRAAQVDVGQVDAGQVSDQQIGPGQARLADFAPRQLGSL